MFLMTRVETNILGHYILVKQKYPEDTPYDLTSPVVQNNYSQIDFLRSTGLEILIKFIKRCVQKVFLPTKHPFL